MVRAFEILSKSFIKAALIFFGKSVVDFNDSSSRFAKDKICKARAVRSNDDFGIVKKMGLLWDRQLFEVNGLKVMFFEKLYKCWLIENFSDGGFGSGM